MSPAGQVHIVHGVKFTPKLLGILNAVSAWLCARWIFPLLFLPALSTLLSTFLLEPMFKPYLTENAA